MRTTAHCLENPIMLQYTAPSHDAAHPNRRAGAQHGKEPIMDRIRFVTHRGQEILLVDCSGCTAEEIAKLADQVPLAVTKQPRGSVLLLGDFSGAHFSKDSVEHLKVAAVFDRPHLKRSAWVLTHNLPKALFESVTMFSQRKIPIFATREEALDYLVSEEAVH
jgi:hypothetical protein